MKAQITKTITIDISSLSDTDYMLNFSSVADLEKQLEEYISECEQHMDDFNEKIDIIDAEISEVMYEAADEEDEDSISQFEMLINILQQNKEELEYSRRRMEIDLEDANIHLENLLNAFEFVKGVNKIMNPYKKQK